MRNKGITEIKLGEARNQVMETGYFPLYYYLKIKNKDYINIDVNLRLNSYDDSVMKNNFNIKGYLLDEETIKRKINGEYIQLSEHLEGKYSNKFKVGLLKVNQKKKYEKDTYLLIEIENKDSPIINCSFLVGIVTKEYYQDVYFMPINQYIIETFNGKNKSIRDKNKYHIYINQKNNSQLLIELSPEYNNIELNFTNETYPEGFKCSDFNCNMKILQGFRRYIIENISNYNINFSVIYPEEKKANYMIRYYYGKEIEGYRYNINDIKKKNYIEKNNENITLSITFAQVKILSNKDDKDVDTNTNITFYISGLLYNKSENSKELINTTSILYERKLMYENKTINVYNYNNPNDFTLIFKNISRKNNYVYDLQLQVNVFIKNNLFNEEFLIFTKEIDLTDILEKSILWYILGPILGVIGLLLIIFVIIKFKKLKRKNIILEEDLKSMAYSNDIQKNVIVKETKEKSKRDKDYESTFI